MTYNRIGRLDRPGYPSDYKIATEVADLQFLLTATGARFVFGVSSGALIVLAALRDARIAGMVDKAALFEPVLVQRNEEGKLDVDVNGLVEQIQKETEEGKIEKALVTGMIGAQMEPGWMKHVPRGWLEGLTGWIVRRQDRKRDAVRKGEKNSSESRVGGEDGDGAE